MMKLQIESCSDPRSLIPMTATHLETVRAMVPGDTVQARVDDALALVATVRARAHGYPCTHPPT